MSGNSGKSMAYDNPDDIGMCDFIPFIVLSDADKKRIDTFTTEARDKDFHCTYAHKKSATSEDKNVLEALETMEICPICDCKSSHKNSGTNYFNYNLSTFLNNYPPKGLKYFIYLHRRGTIDITFVVKKGNKNANDKEGYIEVSANPPYLGIEILSEKKTLKSYNEELKLKIRVKTDEKGDSIPWPFEIYQLDFHSIDNVGKPWYDLEGHVPGSFHCGQFNIISRNCICEDWPEYSSVISLDKFVDYSETGDCFQACLKQIKAVSCKLVNPDFLPATNTSLYQIFVDKNSDKVNDLGEGYKQRFIQALDMVKKSLKNNLPIIAGLDYQDGDTGNSDKTTDHWVVIVGMGKDLMGHYLLYFENWRGYRYGNSKTQKVYCNCWDYTLKSTGLSRTYQVTCLRETEKIK